MTSQERAKLIGERIQTTRKRQGISQTDLQEITGIKNTIISAFENGKRTPNLQSLASIAQALGVTMDVLYFGDEAVRGIEDAPNTGAKITNCFFELMKEGILENNFTKDGRGLTYIHIKEFIPQIQRLSSGFDDFLKKEETYHNPENYIKEQKASFSNDINEEIRKKEQRRQQAYNLAHTPRP